MQRTPLSRRTVLIGGGPAGAPSSESGPFLRPPWTDNARILTACTACGECIRACPQAILSRGGDGRPVVSFAERECTLCGRCAGACPEPVFDIRTDPPFPHTAAVETSCLALRGVHCQTCGDACPENAIRFRPRVGGPPIPAVKTTDCTGCGACAPVCPAEAIDLRARETADA